MGLGERTLQRRLREHGLRFADVLDQVRRAIALERLAGPDASLAGDSFRARLLGSDLLSPRFHALDGDEPGPLSATARRALRLTPSVKAAVARRQDADSVAAGHS